VYVALTNKEPEIREERIPRDFGQARVVVPAPADEEISEPQTLSKSFLESQEEKRLKEEIRRLTE